MMQEMLHRRLSRLTAAEHTAAQLSGELVETYEAQDELAERCCGSRARKLAFDGRDLSRACECKHPADQHRTSRSPRMSCRGCSRRSVRNVHGCKASSNCAIARWMRHRLI